MQHLDLKFLNCVRESSLVARVVTFMVAFAISPQKFWESGEDLWIIFCLSVRPV